MDNEIYEKVKDIAVELVNASAINDQRSQWEYYQELHGICIDNENGINDHPFQWESLADFTNDPNKAIELYKKALSLAESKSLAEYSASILFAIAERYIEIGNKTKACENAIKASEHAKNLDDLELRKEISEFLLNEDR
jgi:tetratricopeptide (TPR) repeat protein